MFEVYRSESGEKIYFRLKAKNGQVILSSQGYANKAGAMNGVESVKKNATDESRYERKESSNGKFFFNLKSGNSQVIGSSQMYASKDGVTRGIQSVMNNAPTAEVKDLTVEA